MAKQVRVGSIIFDFRINAAEFEHQVKEARKQIREMKKEVQRIGKVLRRFTFYATAAAGSMAYFARAAAKDVNELVKMSKALRGGVADLQIMERAAELAGSSFLNMTTALRRMELVLGQLSAGTAEKKMVESWNRLGLEITNVMNLPIDQRWEAITAAITRFIPAAERASVSAQIFGARADIELLKMQASTIQDARKELEEFGGGMERVAATDARQMMEAVNNVGLGLRTLSRELLAEHAPAIRVWARELADSLKPGGMLRNLITTLATAMRKASVAMIEFLHALRAVFGQTTLMVIAIAGVTSGLVSMIGSLGRVARGLVTLTQTGHSAVEAFRAAQGSMNIFSGIMAGLKGSANGLAISLTVGGIAIAAVIAAINLWRGKQEELIDMTRQNYRAVENLSESYYKLEQSIRGVSKATAEMTEKAKKSLQQDIERLRMQALFQESDIMDSDKFKENVRESELLNRRRDNLLDPNSLANAMKEAAAYGMTEEMFIEGRKEAVKAIHKRLNELRDLRASMFNDVDMLRREADEMENKMNSLVGDAATGTPEAVMGGISRGNIGRVLAEMQEEYRRGLQGFNREIEDTMLTTDLFSRMREAKRWHEDITQEINDAGVGYQHLHAEAAQAFETMKRHAAGVYHPLEIATMALDGLTDRFRSVSDAMVDHFVDSGTEKSPAAFRKMALQVAKDLVWMQMRSTLSSIGSHFMGALGTSQIPVGLPQGIGLNPAQALGNTVNANSMPIPMYASGGRHPGGWAMVGERGPEMAYFDGPANIYNAHQTRGMRGGNGSLSVDVSVNPGSNWAEFHANVMGAIEAKAPDIVNAANASMMQNAQRSSNFQDAMRRGMA